MRASSLFAAVLLLGIASSALAAETSPANTSPMSSAEREFVQMAMDSNARELQLSMRAKEKAQSEAVRDFAEMMIEEHGRQGEELAAVSRRMTATGGPPLKRQDKSARALVNELNNLQGDQFDRRYMQAMVSDHEKALRLYERQAKASKDPQLKELAQQTLPELRRHLQMSQTIMADMK